MIKLKITKFDKNEKYDEQLQEWEKAMERARTTYREPAMDRPEPTKVDTILEVELTPEQWEAIRKAVIETF